MKQPPVFLTAEWKQLLMLNYSVDSALLQPFIPAGTELDRFEGRTYVSLVGFLFHKTRVRGIAIPFHGSFEEVNLRFYVKRDARRGVAFIRELVPKHAVAAIARFIYGENYSRAPMFHRIHAEPETGVVKAEYSWGSGPGRCLMGIETEGPSLIPAEGSLGQFITEHYWDTPANPTVAALNTRSSTRNGAWEWRNRRNSQATRLNIMGPNLPGC